MAGKRHEGERAGCCAQADGACAGLAVRRLSQQRLAELAEEIWAASTGSLLPGWPASLDHLVVGATGIWVIESRRGPLMPRRKGTSPWHANSGVAPAIADALAVGASIPVRSLLCVHGAIWPGARRSAEGITLVAPRRLADVVRRGSRLPPRDVQQATARALGVLRPAV